MPESIRSREDLAGCQRVLSYELRIDDAASTTPEQWARATFEGAPTPIPWFLALGFELGLGLKLQRREPDRVLGWQTHTEPANTVTLAASSPLIDGYNVVTVSDACVVWTTLVRYRKGIGRPIWRLTEPLHRVLLPYILSHAGRTREGRPSAP
ncbi:MAG TPA: hypothetical protein VK790_11090 [Solirubrobacteraceae bacterium]|nr:hypothetical protein [Solirubrobacteraceae bacterium]